MARLKGITISTVWEVITYDVWGNEKDGFEVNNMFRDGIVEIPVKLEPYNDFFSGSPSDTEVRKALGIKPRVRIYDPYCNEGVIYANHCSSDYPLGELRLVSHIYRGLDFTCDKVVIRKEKKGKKTLYHLANGDFLEDEDDIKNMLKLGYAIPRKYMELDPYDF